MGVSIPLRKFRKDVHCIGRLFLDRVSIPLRKFRKFAAAAFAEKEEIRFHPSKEV